ncbi:MAG: L,D-transpeptidase family protein [Proteobacteria bacterium]|nr:L,D-transpeptidase family protein [Pseudomonadota bacterium]
MKISKRNIFFLLGIVGLIVLLIGAFTFYRWRTSDRVADARLEKEQLLVENLNKNGLAIDDVHILLAAFKQEKELELYARKKADEVYTLIASYTICAVPGNLGPKRQSGDKQMPEGFYRIDRFNPKSRFHLSLGINYPNESDKIKSQAEDLGGDIFIHGSCYTIGCLPMTDDKIKEIYLYAVFARDNGQSNIPVYIFPFRMTDDNLQTHVSLYADNPALTGFWENLKIGYDKFVSEKRALNVSVNELGDYVF